jgi:hypothetical protein
VSQAQSDLIDYDDYWIPSVSLALSAHNEKGALFGDNASPEQTFGFETTEGTTLAGLRMGLELLSPVVHLGKNLKPRFFASAGVLYAAPSNGLVVVRDNARTRDDYREVALAANVDRQDDVEFSDPDAQSINVDDPQIFEGQGNRITSEQQNNAWFFSAGVAFSYPFAGFTVRIRPSIEYLGEFIKTTGEFRLVTKGVLAADAGHSPPDVLTLQENFILHNGFLEGRDTHHSMGPGLELEFINHLDGNLTLSLFTQIRVLWIMNNTKTVIKGFGTNDDGGVDQTRAAPAAPLAATYSFERDRFNFRGGVGIRLGWKDLAFKF